MSTSSDQPLPHPQATAAAKSPAHQQVMAFINHRMNFERIPAEQYDLQDFKLARMQELLARLGDPQQAIPAVHIAGTKGKGSTAAMTASVLSAVGSRVGLFTSPHLESIGERMTVNGRQPTDEELLAAMQHVRPVVEQMDGLGQTMQPTFFECITAIAWTHFARCMVDLVVLEVGLGGRLDATNICSPLVTVITSISRDHERLLGDTLTKIATEKAGIIKAGIPVISGVTQPEPRDVIRDTVDVLDCPLYELDRDIHWSTADIPSSSSHVNAGLVPLPIDIQTPWSTHRVRVPLLGTHQARNLALALSACDLLAQGRDAIPNNAVNRALAELHWPLRIEVLRRSPCVIVDAAHNDASVDSLIETLSHVSAGERLLIFATSKDKDTADLLRRLNGHFDRAILTQFIGNPRSVPVDTLSDIASDYFRIPFEVADNPTVAWDLARKQASASDLICATGSFFLAAEMRAIILATPLAT